MKHKANTRRIYAADIGSTRCDRGAAPKFAWVCIDPDHPDDVRGSSDIEAFAKSIATSLAAGISVAVGFEAPMFIPVPDEASDLCRGRAGEGSRSFAAPAGLAVSALGLHQAAWVLRYLRGAVSNTASFTMDDERWPPAPGHPLLYCWEAFVSGPAHSEMHIRDAATAAVEFMRNESHLCVINAVEAQSPISLLSAAALWSGWTDDVSLLHRPCLVIKPSRAFDGVIAEA